VKPLLACSLTVHDPSLTLLTPDGGLWAIELERLSRRRYNLVDHDELTAAYLAGAVPNGGPDDRLVGRGVGYLLEAAGLSAEDVDVVGARPGDRRVELGGRHLDLRVGHHEAHAASAAYPSGFAECAVLIVDALGEPRGYGLAESVSIWHCRGASLERVHEVLSPSSGRRHTSLGLFYSDMTILAGFRVLDAGKTMGLAPYGDRRFVEAVRGAVRWDAPDGQAVFDRDALAPIRARRGEEGFAASVARAAQEVLEEVLARYARLAVELTGSRALAMAGGVALNSVANQWLLDDGVVDELWVQPAANDGGLSLGAGLRARAVRGEAMPSDYKGFRLGRSYGPTAAPPVDETVDLLLRGAIVGLVEGGSEFGPRALGRRSLLALPADAAMKDRINARKGREGFRPVAPVVRWPEARRWFAIESPSPYMLRVVPVLSDALPAVTHVDGTARVQTLRSGESDTLWALLAALEERGHPGVLVNTSLNARGEPITETPDEALALLEDGSVDALLLDGELRRRRA